jgi:hypothetical protein
VEVVAAAAVVAAEEAAARVQAEAHQVARLLQPVVPAAAARITG